MTDVKSFIRFSYERLWHTWTKWIQNIVRKCQENSVACFFLLVGMVPFHLRLKKACCERVCEIKYELRLQNVCSKPVWCSDCEITSTDLRNLFSSVIRSMAQGKEIMFWDRGSISCNICSRRMDKNERFSTLSFPTSYVTCHPRVARGVRSACTRCWRPLPHKRATNSSRVAFFSVLWLPLFEKHSNFVWRSLKLRLAVIYNYNYYAQHVNKGHKEQHINY